MKRLILPKCLNLPFRHQSNDNNLLRKKVRLFSEEGNPATKIFGWIDVIKWVINKFFKNSIKLKRLTLMNHTNKIFLEPHKQEIKTSYLKDLLKLIPILINQILRFSNWWIIFKITIKVLPRNLKNSCEKLLSSLNFFNIQW